jgi:hypothetical protein
MIKWNERFFNNERDAKAFKYELDNVCCGVTSEFIFLTNGYLVKWKKDILN